MRAAFDAVSDDVRGSSSPKSEDVDEGEGEVYEVRAVGTMGALTEVMRASREVRRLEEAVSLRGNDCVFVDLNDEAVALSLAGVFDFIVGLTTESVASGTARLTG